MRTHVLFLSSSSFVTTFLKSVDRDEFGCFAPFFLIRQSLAICCLLIESDCTEFFGELEENQLARSRFLWDAEGWNCSTKDGAMWPVSGELQQLKSSDDDDTIWYYTASAEFLGENFIKIYVLCNTIKIFLNIAVVLMSRQQSGSLRGDDQLYAWSQ